MLQRYRQRVIEECDRRGRFWFGSMNNITHGSEGLLFRLYNCANLIASLLDVRIPHSLVWGSDRQATYFAAHIVILHEILSLLRTIVAYAFDPATGEQKLLAKTVPPVIPDGAAMNADCYLGNVEYHGRQITRCTPDCHVYHIIDLRVRRPTICAFDGSSFDAPYVTIATQQLTRKKRCAATAHRCAADIRRWRPYSIQRTVKSGRENTCKLAGQRRPMWQTGQRFLSTVCRSSMLASVGARLHWTPSI
jgi:sugar lactone lactonase YvrE